MSSLKRLAARAAARMLTALKSNQQFRDAYSSVTDEGVNREQFAGVQEQEQMQADDVRFDAYRRAVEKHIQPGDTVVDVGTSSGVLSRTGSRTSSSTRCTAPSSIRPGRSTSSSTSRSAARSTPNFRVEPRMCRKGDILDFWMSIDDIRSMESWRIEL